ncbi:MAG: DEAD/DEAH box helicase, partial [SAR116 cluster bacterium]|nr:DEAD/DEAH box helicase [SAR116 cluster bacterium]
PTPIQQEAIPAILAGHDLIGLAQTGTGKTAAYLLPLLNKLLDKRKAKEVRRTSLLILAPTRELAYQISDSIKAFSGSFKVRYITICGGERYDFQIRSLNKGVDVIVATPGRFEDLQARGKVKLDDIEHFVLDEGDQMIDLGFYPAIKRIFETLPSTCQTVFFSATMPKEMETLAESFLKDAVTIRAARAGETVDAIEQSAVLVKGMDKRDVLLQELQKLDGGQVLVFARTRVRTEDLADWLGEQGLNADMLHGDMRQAIRLKVLRKFKRGELQVLVATDVAARGIDVSGLGMVVNFDLPDTVEAYVHRIGRTGRAGQVGAALSICSVADQEKLAAVLSRVGQRMTVIDSDGSVIEDCRPERVRSKGRGRGRARPPRHARANRPAGAEKAGGKPRPKRGASQPGRPARRPSSDRWNDDRRDGERRDGDRGGSGKPSFGKKAFDKTKSDRPKSDRARSDKPKQNKSKGDKPFRKDRQDKQQARPDRGDKPKHSDFKAGKGGKPPHKSGPAKQGKPSKSPKPGRQDRAAKSGPGELKGKKLSLRPGGTGEGTRKRGPLKPGRGAGGNARLRRRTSR